MTDEQRIEKAREKLKEICNILQEMGIRYAVSEELPLKVEFPVKSNDIPIILKIFVCPDEELITVFSTLPINIPEDKWCDMIMAINHINSRTVNGGFNFDFETGKVFFKLCNTYKGAPLNNDGYKYMIEAARESIDLYNDKFFKLAKGFMPLRDFLLNNDK